MRESGVLGSERDGKVRSEIFERCYEGTRIEIGWKAEDAGGMKEGVAGHWGGLEVGVQFLNVAPGSGDGDRELADDSGTIVADDIEIEHPRFGGGHGGFLHGVDRKAVQGLEGREEGRGLVGGSFDAHDSGKETGEMGHAGFQPAALVELNGGREGFDQTGAVGSDDGHDKRLAHK